MYDTLTFIPENQKDNYFTSFRLGDLKYAKLNANRTKSTIDYTDASGTLVKPFKLYGINDQHQSELIKEYSNVEEMTTTIKLDSSKHYQHLVLEHSGIEDKYYKDGEKIKIKEFNAFLDVKVPSWKEKSEDNQITRYENQINLSFSENLNQASSEVRPKTGRDVSAIHAKTPYDLSLEMNALNGRGVNSRDISRGQTLPVIVSYHAADYFKSLNDTENGVETRNLSKLDPNVTETKIMLLADPKLPLKDFRVTTDNRLLTTDVVYTPIEDRALSDYDKIKEKYTTVIPTRTITNYKNTGKTAYIFDTKDLGITKYDVSENITGEYGYKPVALAFEVENTGLVESNTYNIESYLVWNSNSQTLKGRDRSLNSDYVDGHENGNTIARASVDVKLTNVIEYYTALGISKPGTPVVRGIIDVVNGNEVTLTPTIQNLTDSPQQVKEAIVLVPKKEAVTYLEGPIVDNSDSWEVLYTTSTVEDKTTATYVTANQVSNWKDVTAVKYVFKSDYRVTKAAPFVDHFNVRVDQQNANFIRSTSQIFLKNAQGTWLESNVVVLRTEDIRGKVISRYYTTSGLDLSPEYSEARRTTEGFANESYTTNKNDVMNKNGRTYIYKELDPTSATPSGTYEKQVTKKVTYLYEEAKEVTETKEVKRTINYLEKNNETNVLSQPVEQVVTVSRKVYTGKETGRRIEGEWIIENNTKWTEVPSPILSGWEKPEVKVNDQYIAKAAIDEVRITPEILNKGNVVENVYYERFVPVGGDVVAKYVIEGTTTELKAETDVAKGLKVGKNYTSTAPVAGEELTATDGKVYVYKGHKATSAGEQGTVTADKQEVVYEYAPKVGGNVEVKYVIAGTETNLKDPVTLVTNGQVGSDYTATKDTTIRKEDGRVYKLVEANNGLKTGSAAEIGKVSTEKQTVTYEYVLQNGDVTVKYEDEAGNAISTPNELKKGVETGTAYNTTSEDIKKPRIQTEDGKVYKLKEKKADSAPEDGKVSDTPAVITYVYTLENGDVTVKYEDEAGESIKPDNNLKSQVPTGDEYNTTTVKDLTITKDGKLYKLVEKNGGLKEGSSKENGKVSDTPTVVTYVYSEVKGEIIQKFVDESGKQIKDPTNTGKKSLNEKVNLEHPNRITDKDGKVYEFVKVDKIPTNFTEQLQTATYTYRVVKGQGVTVSYETTTGVPLKETQTVQPKDTQLGTDYDTTTSNFKPERIEKDGKVYILTATTKPGSAEKKGKVTEQTQNVTYVYEEVKEPETKQKYGNVIVTYVDKAGRPLSGTTETGVKVDKSVIDTPASLVKTPYDTTDNKPETIKTAEGKVYKFVKVTQHSDAENSDVKSRISVITYVYELQNTTEELPEAHIGFVVVNYVDENGLPISGTSEGKEIPTTMMDVNGDLVGTQYDTTDHKPTTITTANGDVYEFVKKSESSAPESGELKEGVATVEYVYRKVITTYVDETGKEINPSDKGTKDKKDIPEYIYKETKKDEKGNTTHVYRQVVTSYVDEAGKEINPSDKGMKDKKEISGYTFKETKKDKDGNTVHVYRKKQSSTPENPTPETPNTDKSTIWKSVDGETLKPRENGTKDKSSIPGYEFVRTEKDKEGNTVHIYRKVTSSTPEVKEKETSYIDESGKEIRSPKKGNHPKEMISGYEFVRTETESNGNVRHVYRQVAQSPATVNTPETVEQPKIELPNTGTGDEFAIFGAAAASILAGLGIAIPGKKKED